MGLLSIFGLLLLFSSGYCNDLLLGYPDPTSRLIYTKVHQENPALWIRSDTFTVHCSGNEVINAIRVLDLRQDKWGDAYIKGGGIGQKFVTIELDSPSIFRGFNFLVEVYAIRTNYFMMGYGNNMGLQEFEKWSKQPDLFSDKSRMCIRLRGLTRGQRRICRRHKDHMPVVGAGVRKGIDECQYQFKRRRWNCTVTADETVFGPLTLIASRETAFTHAITAAGVSLTVSRACRDGRLSSCSCSRAAKPRNLHSDWVWGGCGDNLEYGYKFTEGFVDVREREGKVKRGSREQGRRLMNRHNNEAGRRAVIAKSRVTCKCHGVSGSCSLITCWQQLPSFREVGDYLKDKYEGATEVKVSRRGKLRIGNPHFSLPTARDLVYLEESPNYCIRNETLGSLGTVGRECNRTSSGIDSCTLMCCGRGYNTKRQIVKERCGCKFHWCCHVECNTCVRTVEVYTSPTRLPSCGTATSTIMARLADRSTITMSGLLALVHLSVIIDQRK